MSLALWNNLPGIDTQVNTVENEYWWGPAFPWACIGVILDAASVDAGDTPTTTLRRGLVLGQIASSLKYKAYDPTATDGSQVAVGVLDTTTDMNDPRSGSTRDKVAQLRVWGFVKVGSLFGFDENARVQLSPRFVFDDLRLIDRDFSQVVAKAANYTVVAADNGKTFTTSGAAGEVDFTLPAVARGYRFRFHNVVGQTMKVIAPAGKLVTFNNNAATSVAFQTAGNLIGGTIEIVSNDDGSKYIAIPGGANTLTVA